MVLKYILTTIYRLKITRKTHLIFRKIIIKYRQGFTTQVLQVISERTTWITGRLVAVSLSRFLISPAFGNCSHKFHVYLVLLKDYLFKLMKFKVITKLLRELLRRNTYSGSTVTTAAKAIFDCLITNKTYFYLHLLIELFIL